MQQTSPSYNPYTDERYVGIGISFQLMDPDAAGDATASATYPTAFSQPSQLITGAPSPGKIMTMEDNLVLLDGTWIPAPDGMIVPYWSTVLSGPDGTFATPPSVTMELSSNASSVGFTLQFDDAAQVWPSSVQITAYSGTTQLAQQTFSVSSAQFVADMPVDGYDKVVFEFLQTPVPYRRIRLYEIIFGVVESFSPASVSTVTFEYGASLDCGAIPSRQLVFTFDNSDRAYNLFNPDGLYAYLQDGQQLQAYLTINGEKVNMGAFFYTDASAEDDALTAKITANDSVMQLENSTYDAGETGTWTFSEAVAAILGDAPVNIPESLASTMVGKAIPVGTTRREALRLVSQAACCSCWVDRAGTYVFADLTQAAASPVDTLNEDNMYNMACIGVTPYYDSVVLTVRDEFSDTEPQEYTAGSGTNVKSYSNPCAVNGQTVADWLLAANQRRLIYTPKNRGNPAVEIGDTISIYNAYDEPGNAVVTKQTLTYNGGLSANTEAIGG